MTDENDSRGMEYPHLMPAGQGRRARHAVLGPMGDTQWHPDPIVNHPELAEYNMPPAYYVCTGTLGSEEGDRVTLREDLRPEPFVCKRVTWATTGDVPQDESLADSFFPFGSSSQMGRSIEVLSWGDEFTSFNGKEPGLLSAMFGDSNGFLDLPDLIIFQGSQELLVEIQRVIWPFESSDFKPPRYNVRVDVMFEGVGLLPKNVQQSGSA